MEKIVNIQIVNPDNLQLQNYSEEDNSLIVNYTEDIVFNPAEDYIEYFILDLNQDILYKNEIGYPNFKLIDNLVSIDPQNDLEIQGYTEGQYYTIYNFLKRKLSSNPENPFFIQDISPDRTELRLNTTTISNLDIIDLTSQFALQIASSIGSYLDFALDFGNNKLIIANNIALDDTDPNDPTVLIKLYEPLPQNFTFNSQCWVVEQTAESRAYQIELTTIFESEEQSNYILGPNFNLDIQDQINNSTPYYNQNTLQANTSLLGSGSLLYQINSILAEKGIEINIDYSDYSQFINFSSAQTRLENFYYKLSLIEQYTLSASYSNGSTLNSFTSGSQIIWQNKINDIITNFDGYEYYLYYESGSYAWPKSNSLPPYNNLSTTDPISLAWLTTQLDSALYFDSENNNNLLNSIPDYLREDDNNDQYFLFIQMLGQNFDNVWIYLKDITNKFDADNRLNYGISKDIVAQAIRDLGVKIYQNNFSSDNLYSALLGITPSGSLFNVPNITSTLPTPTGLEYVNTYISASAPESLEPVDDINKEIYNRIYHNLPALLKRKGTIQGLGLLLDIYGIPDTILRLNEFGGNSTKAQAWDNFTEVFNYAFTTDGNGWVQTPWNYLTDSGDYFPGAVEFRFKTKGIPSTTPYSQILCYAGGNFAILLTYNGTGYASGSYSGSIPDPTNEYGILEYYDIYNTNPAGIISNLPFFNGDWWTVTLNLKTGLAGYETEIYTANKTYTGYDGNIIGFQASYSMVGVNPFILPNYNLQLSSDTSYTGLSNFAGISYPFSGSFQELRYYGYTTPSPTMDLPKSIFEDYVMNPYSIEGKTPTGSSSAFNSLFFRAPLGTMLDNSGSGTQTRSSIHPAISQYPPTSAFIGPYNDYTLNGIYTFEPNTEVIYQDQFNMGIKNSISEKIRIVDTVLPAGDTLSQYISIQQHSYVSESFTKDVNYFEAAFSPQDEVNDDIIAQLGSFNVGDYIGDPRNIVNSTLTYYPDFNKLRDYYFSKYTHSYDLNDYIRLIKFFDNSLFKMIKDFTPARTGLASGIVIKPTLLERQRYPVPQATTNSIIAFVGSPTTKTLNIPL